MDGQDYNQRWFMRATVIVVVFPLLLLTVARQTQAQQLEPLVRVLRTFTADGGVTHSVYILGLLVNTAGLVVSAIGLLVAATGLVFVVRQLRNATKTTKSQMAVRLISRIYSDETIQRILNAIYLNRLEFEFCKVPERAIVWERTLSETREVTTQVDTLLNELQLIGYLRHIKVFREPDLEGVRYEVLRVGRCQAVRKYLEYLAIPYQTYSGVVHEHFPFLRELYLAMEYNPELSKSFTDQVPHIENPRP